jgi:hypothetical protein
VPLARDLHPEFGYVGSAPRLFRKLGLMSVFAAFGLVAAASGVAVFMAGSEPDPMNAMALAPAEALIAPSPRPASPAQARVVERQTIPADASRPPCRDYASERFGDDCISLRIRKPRPVQPLNERPAIAAVPIGHRDDPSVLAAPATVAAIPAPPKASATVAAIPAAPKATATVAALPAPPPEVTAAPTPAREAPFAAPSAPAAPVAKPAQTRARHARREGNSSAREGNSSVRERNSSARESYSYARTARAPALGGYAGFWARPW